ncbi:MAG: hypothetical protein A3H35_17800 [Betaproteobacteria bacterium RIFCSPLOWO2_02_FULL_62_17]|nr:MAG: hypothetical protein A3H35_17800 [Betaproteobacteria bacterium RIFCSPLOWO2_02_FULL_62_17]
MKIAREDYKHLRLPLAAAALLIAMGVTCLAVSETWLMDARKARDTAKNSNAQAQKRLDQVSEEEREIKENMLWYARMASRGMVEQENRLDLIDSIAKIKTARKLFEIRYNIESQRPLGYPGLTPAGAMDLVGSRMKLDMQLLHEEDLLRFLSDLGAAALSHVSVRRCTLDRIERGQSLAAVPRLSTSCELDLVAVKQVKSS